MCMPKAPSVPEQETPAPAAAPAPSVTPELGSSKRSKSDQIRGAARGKKRFVVKRGKQKTTASGLNIPS